MQEIDRDALLGLPVQDFITRIMLRRVMHAHDNWSGTSDARTVVASIFHTTEFIQKNAAFGEKSDILDATEMQTTTSVELVDRIYQYLLGRAPTEIETDAVVKEDQVCFGELCAKICWTEEFLSHIGSGAEPNRSYGVIRDDMILYSKYMLMDNYNLALKNVLTDTTRDTDKFRRFAKADEIDLYIALYDSMHEDIDYTLGLLAQLLPGKKFNIHMKTEGEIAEGGFPDTPTIYITNNNFLYFRHNEIMPKLHGNRNLISACWLFDNHHQFNFSIDATKHFDVIFPAHCNGTEYLYGRKALVGPVVACPVIQWSRTAAIKLFAEFHPVQRDNELYGRFSSYEGRVTSRDKFLNLVSAQDFGKHVISLSLQKQDWSSKTPAERFHDFMRHKISITTPILNDISLRVFDGLLAGEIPILPYGALGLAASIANADQYALPVRSYMPNDVNSLRHAVETAIAAFDEGGDEGVVRRHKYAADNHMLCHRVVQMVYDIVNLGNA